VKARLAALSSLLIVLAFALPQTRQTPMLDEVVDALSFRNIGPFRTAAWVTEIAVPDAPAREHQYTIYAATRSGGLWKTVNNGITWDVISDSVDVAAVGAVAVAPSNANIVWMGTGDQANARSSYSGKGVFKSSDAGKTWQFMGLPDSHHIARIVIHPKNPNVVYVAAMGHLFSRNEERGVFRTTDGGATWQKVLYVDDGTGAIDLVMNRRSPDTLYAAMYEKHRRPWELVLGGPGSGVYKTDNGGRTWRRLEGGLPSGEIGRIGLDLNQRNPNVLYAVVENVNPRTEAMGPSVDACAVTRPGQPAPVLRPGARVGNEVYRSDDGGRTWRKTHGDDVDVAGSKAPYSFNQLRMSPDDPNRLIITSDQMYVSEDGGRSWGCSNANGFFRGVFGDFRSIWWDPQDSRRIMLGSDGGVNVSYDGGETARYFPNMAVGEVYAIGVDMDDPYNVYAGLQDHDSWKGPSNSPTGRITLEQWTTVGPGDGMYNQVDPTDSRWVYNTRETGNHGRLDQRTGQRTVIAPSRSPEHRYGWITPIVLSPHNPQIVYAGAELVYRSLDRGDTWEEISPDLTANDSRCGIGSGFVPFCTITTISESPVRPGVIWVGTDDGKVHVTENHGAAWRDVTAAIAAAGGPADRYVSRVFASPHDAATALVAKSGFRNDDFAPYLYRTTDYGRTWTSIGGGLPDAPINVVVQDRVNPNLLVVGNDLGVFVSIDNGAGWTRLRANLPTVPVHDLTVHPRENDLVLGTYGRAIWVGDISPLRELTPDTLASRAYLFDIEPRARYDFRAIGNYHLFGDAYLEVPNEPDAIAITYLLAADADAPAKITVRDFAGRVVREIEGPAKRGLNTALWPIGAGGRGFGGGGRGGPPPAPPAVGDYMVTVEVAGETLTKPARVRERL